MLCKISITEGGVEEVCFGRKTKSTINRSIVESIVTYAADIWDSITEEETNRILTK